LVFRAAEKPNSAWGEEKMKKCKLCKRQIDGSFGKLCCRCDQIRFDAEMDAIEQGEIL